MIERIADEVVERDCGSVEPNTIANLRRQADPLRSIEAYDAIRRVTARNEDVRSRANGP